MTQKPERQVTTILKDGERMAAWGDNQALLALGKGCVVTSAAPDTLARAGDHSVIAMPWFDNKKKRWRMAVGYVGEDLKPNTWYRIKGAGKFQEVKQL